MKKKPTAPVDRTPADMHSDGVHFDPDVKAALEAERKATEKEIKRKNSQQKSELNSDI